MEERKILINERFLSIPPKLSISWKDIASLYMKEDGLHILIKEGEKIILDELQDEAIDTIFHHHALFLEKRAEDHHRELMGPLGKLMQMPEGLDATIRVGFPPIDTMGMMVQHNPDHKEAPPLPNELLEKVSGVIRLLTDDIEALPKPESNCNCFHCQIARTFNPAAKEADTEEEIPLHELSFSDWQVEESGEKLYTVKSKLNPEERYSVFLGSPVGCTCGNPSCEHVVAALKS